MFWDASAESLGIGTTSPTQKLTVAGTDGLGIDDYIIHNGDGNTKFGFLALTHLRSEQAVQTRSVNSSQNVGIGTSSPSRPLHVNNNDGIRVGATASYQLDLKGGQTPTVTVGGSTIASVITTSGTGSASGHIGLEIHQTIQTIAFTLPQMLIATAL